MQLAKAQDSVPPKSALVGGTIWELKYDGYRAPLRVTGQGAVRGRFGYREGLHGHKSQWLRPASGILTHYTRGDTIVAAYKFNAAAGRNCSRRVYLRGAVPAMFTGPPPSRVRFTKAGTFD